jgi:hypothetical protein
MFPEIITVLKWYHIGSHENIQSIVMRVLKRLLENDFQQCFQTCQRWNMHIKSKENCI